MLRGRVAAALRAAEIPKEAYVVPAYEIDIEEEGETAGGGGGVVNQSRGPETKTELLRWKITSNSAVRPFYSQVCWKCQVYSIQWNFAPRDFTGLVQFFP